MRINSISPEFIYNEVNGTLSTKESKSFFGSKLMKFTDTIEIKNENLIYYQNNNNEQINFNSEKNSSPIIYDTSINKYNNSLLKIDESQKKEQLNNNTKWNLNINYKNILIDYIFSTLKKYRTFEGVKNEMVISNDVNIAIRDYINLNLLSRYKLDKIELFLSYNDLLNGNLKLNNSWSQIIDNKDNLINRFETKTDLINMTIDLIFNQEKSSTFYSFNYYFNLYFIKI